MSEKTTKKGIIGIKDKFGYMLGDIGCNMVLALCSSYLLIFYTKVMGVTAAVVGTVMMAAKIVDAFTDVTMGRINDTWANKKGDRFRPWILIGSVPLVISSCAMYSFFLADAAYIVKVIWLVVTYIIFGSVCYTMVNIPYGAMSNVITPDSSERTSLSTWRMVGSTLGGLVLGIAIPLFIYVKDADGNSVVSGVNFFVLSIVLGVLALICLISCYLMTKERVKGVIEKKSDSAGIGSTLKVMKGCLADRALLMSFLAAIFLNAATLIFSLYNQYVFLDYFGSTALSGIAALSLAVGMFFAAPLVGPLAKKFGKKEVSVFGMGLAAAVFAAGLIVSPANPFVYIGIVFVAFFGLGLVSMVQYSLLNDCVDKHYLETGSQVTGTAYGMNAFMRKLAAALCTGLGGWGLTWIGYNEIAIVQTAAVQKSIFTLSTGFVTGCFVLSLVFVLLIPMNKKQAEEIAAKMSEAAQKDNV